ncbi:MAG: hypothetical protein ACK5Q5_23295 [Planctomycetaceae bacterium]
MLRKRRQASALSRSIELLEDRTLLAAAWVNVGPFSAEGGQSENASPNDRIAGAMSTVLAHPTNSNILYAGSVNGGVWRTFNATGATPDWQPLTDDLPGNSIGALVFDHADTSFRTIYAGYGRYSSFGRIGTSRAGLIKSTDGGDTWTVIDGGGSLVGKNISGIVANGNTITVSVNTANVFSSGNVGIFRSTDGGATFTKVINGLPQGVSYDLVNVPSNPNVMYTSVALLGGAGVFKSIDGGASWNKVSNAAMDVLFSANTSNVEFAAGIFNNVYVGILNAGNLVGFFRSGDGGSTWAAMDIPATNENGTDVGLNPVGVTGPLSGTPEEIAGGQGSIHFSIIADPNDPNVVYVGGDRQPTSNGDNGSFPNSIGARDYSGRLFRGNATFATGSQWVHLTHSRNLGAPGGGTISNSSPHADSRDMTFDINGDLVEVDDGGIYRRTSPRDNNGDWFSISGNLAVAEVHDVAYDSLSNTIITGNQDNGTQVQPTANATLWGVITGGDGGDVAVDDVSLAASGQSIRYSSFQNLGGFIRTTWDASGNFVSFSQVTLSGATLTPGFVTPISLNKINPQRIVIQGANGIFESTDRGNTIANVGTAAGGTSIRQDAIVYGGRKGGVDNADVLWVGSGNNVYFRQGTGNVAATAADPTGQEVRDLAVDPDDWAIAYVLDPNQVFVTTNNGGAWADVTGNLMSTVNELYSIEYIASPTVDAVIVGTDRGVYAMSTTAPGEWVKMGDDAMPNVIVDEFDYDVADDRLVVGTLGRGVWMMDGVISELVNIVGPSRLNLSINPVVLAENGGLTTATVTRNGVLTNPLTVDLSTDDGTETFLPATVTILAGQSSATFAISGVDDLLPDSTQTVTITASAAGFADGVGTVYVIDNETAELTLTIDPTTIQENGGFATGTVTRSSGVNGDLVVTLLSSDLTEAGTPATVTILDGQDTATFTVFGIDDSIADGTQNVTITASAAGHANGTAMIQVFDDEALTLAVTPLRISENGGVATGTVTRHTGTVGDLVVQLTSSDTTEASVPATVVILDGQSSATFQITAVDDLLADGDQLVTITATAAALGAKSVQLTVVDDEVAGLSVSIVPMQINENGGLAIGTVTRNTPVDFDLIVSLTSSDTTEALVPTSVLIPAGSASATFLVVAVDDSIEDPVQVVRVTAQAVGHASGWDTVNVIDDDSAYFYGTNGDDDFVFIAGDPGASHVVRVNGVTTVLRRSIRVVRFIGQEGNDRLRALGTSLNDTVTFSPTAVRFIGPQFEMSARSVETTLIDGRGGNNDALFFDAVTDDVFVAGPQIAVMAGVGFENNAYNFARTSAMSKAGGNDVTILRDSAGNDSFSARPGLAALAGTGFRNVTRGFERVIGRALKGGSRDVAELFDGTGNDSFNSTPTEAMLTGPEVSISTVGFDIVSAYATSGANAALMIGSRGDDVFIGRDRIAALSGPGFQSNAYGFARVTVRAEVGNDVAYLFDSVGTDSFTGSSDTGSLQGSSFLNRVIGFDAVSIYGYFGTNYSNVSRPKFALREFGTWV